MGRPSKKSPAKSPAEPGALVPQPHGGQIRRGAQPGTNRGGTGRPPSELRRKMRGSLEDRLHIAEEIADSPTAAYSDRMKALDFLAKYGLGTRQEVTGEDGAAIPTEIVVTRRVIKADK